MFTSLTGCALIVPDNSRALEQKAVSVGTTVLSKQQVVDLWYDFYNQNANAFVYYSEDQIVEIFYKNIVLKHAVMQETFKLIDAGKIEYTERDEANVWVNTFKSFVKSVDSIEKALYTQQGVENENLPKRLQTEETASSGNSDIKSFLYTEYDFTGMEDYKCKYTPENNNGVAIGDRKVGDKITDEQILELQSVFATYLYKTPVTTADDEDEVEYISIQDLKNKLANTDYYTSITNKTNREKAFDMLVGRLMISAKANGETLNRQQAFVKELKKIYISSYETYIQNMYSNYINSLVDQKDSNYYTLSDQAIVARYLQLLGSDIQKYKLEENYVAVLEAKADNALLLYRYNGEYYYFTVQHLLVSFDESITNVLANMYGNEANASLTQYNIYKSIRDTFYTQKGLNNWEEYNNATYRDENGYEVYSYYNEEDSTTYKVYFDKDFVAPEAEEGEEIAEEDVQNGYYYTKSGSTDKVYLTKAQFDTCTKATTTVGAVITEFNNTYKATIEYLNQANSLTKDAAELKEGLEDIAAISYVISEDLIAAYMNGLKTGNTQLINELKNKVYTNIFMQHAFKYSTDSASLGTELSNYVGMVISGRPDNHTVGGGTYVNEFTDKARELAKQYIANKAANNAYASQLVGTSTSEVSNFAISDYGIHMIVVNDVYKVSESAPITGNTITAESIFGSQNNVLTQAEIDANVAAAVAKMKAVYVSSTSSQTLYEYLYEQLRNELVGDNGSTFTKERNRLYNEYVNPAEGEAKADLSGQMSYDELMDAIK